jgi:NADPH:quinone reductase-like Zn-dependent oxidoreductase
LEEDAALKAFVISHAGGPEQLQLKDVTTPKVRAGWSLVKIKGFGINRSEIFTRLGYSPVIFPRILGIEGVGVIAESTDPTRLPQGQKVVSLMHGMGREFDGSYAQYALLPNNNIYPVTTHLSWPELAAIPETYFTAYGSLLAMKIQQANSLLIRAATSGVGIAAMKLAKAMNPTISTTGSTRNKNKLAQLKAVGFDQSILDSNRYLQTKSHFDSILELVGPATLVNSLQLLNSGGILCNTGELGGMDDPKWTMNNFDPFKIPSGAYLTIFSSDTVNEKTFNDLIGLIAHHHINVKPTKVFDFAHTPNAQATLDHPDSFGKVVVLT